jgi:hypothetical protein
MGISCGACENLPDGVYLCHECTGWLERDLGDVAAAVDALWATAARLDVGGGTVGTSGHSVASEPSNSRAMDAGRTLNVILTGWCDTLGYREPHAIKAAAVLLAHIREVRTSDWGPDLKAELREIMYECDRITDRTAERISLGACTVFDEYGRCTGQIVGIQGQPIAWCRACGAETNVHLHQQMQIAEAWHVRASLPEILRALKYSGHLNVPIKRVQHWVQRGKLKPVAPNLFTPADVLAAHRAVEAYKAGIAARIASKQEAAA